MGLFSPPLNDWRYFDGTEPILYCSRLTENTYATSVAVPNALRRTPSADQLESPGLLGKSPMIWNVWAVQLPGVQPKLRDKITLPAGGGGWYVMKVETMTMGTRYRLTCVSSH